MAASTRSRYLALVACLTLALAGIPGVGTSLAQAAEPTNPSIGVAPDGDSMWGGSGWTADNTIDVTIDDPATGPGADYSTAVISGSDEWRLDLAGVFDIQPGHFITATDSVAGITKTHEVREFSIDTVNDATDMVEGSAPAGTTLTVKSFSPEECDTTVVADGTDTWSADFGVLVSAGGQPCDIEPGWNGSAEWYDDTDNDHTFIGWQADDPPTPHFNVDPHSESIWGHEWTPHSSVDITINGEVVDIPETTGSGDFATGFDPTVRDIAAGDHVVVGDGPTTKELFVTDVTVTDVDVDNHRVSGTADSAFVNVWIDNTDVWRNETVTGGMWTADFAAPGDEPGEEPTAELTPGTTGAASDCDADGDCTFAGWGVPNPSFTVETPWDIWSTGEDWIEGDTVSMAIDDPATGPGADYTDSTHVERWGPLPWEVGFSFDTRDVFDIVPGHTVTITADGTAKMLDVVDLTVTDVDEAADTVSGTAPAGASVEVNGSDEFGTGAHRSVLTDASGNWVADFATPGTQPHEQDLLDIAPGIGGGVEVYDDDQDSTHRGWRVADPWIAVDVVHEELWANDWPLGDTLHYTIEDPDTPESPDKSGEMLVVSGGQGQTEAGDRMFDGFDIRAGQTLTVWNDSMIRELLISNLEVTDVDPDADTIAGTADPGTEVCAWTYQAYLCTTTDASGNWLAHFTTVGGDVRPGDHNGASQEDSDGDQTNFSWHVPPWIYVELAEQDAAGNDLYLDSIQLEQWEGPEVTVSVNGVVIATPTVDPDGWHTVEHDVDVGDTVEVFDPAGPTITQDVTKTLTIEDLSITSLTRFDEDPPSTVFGEAAPTGGERSVQATISTEYGWWAERWVNSNTGGAWQADFANPGFGWREQWTSDFGSGAANDILNGGEVRSAIWDDDNDQTQAVWHPTNPRVIVIQGDPDQVHAIDFTEGSIVTVEIDDPATPVAPDWDDSGVAIVDPDKPWSTLLVFEVVDYDIPEQAAVTASDGETTVTHDVVAFTIEAVDPDLDTVSGTAAAGTEVLVEADGHWRYPVTDAAGNWTADFAVPGNQPGEEQPVDIQPGSSGRAVVVATNGSATTLMWQLAHPPTFTVWVDEGIVHGYEWPDGAEVDIEIDDPSNGPGVDYTATATSGPAEWDPAQTVAEFRPGEDGFTLEPAQIVTMTHGAVTKSTVVAALNVDVVDESADTVAGTAPPDTQVDSSVEDDSGDGSNRTVQSDALGNWMADFSVPWQDQPAWDIGPGTRGSAFVQDDDGDATARGWQIANPTFTVETPWDVWSGGEDWVEGDIVELTIDGYTDTTTVERWGPEPWEVGFNFHTEGHADIAPGDLVTITTNGTVKTLTVVDLTIDVVDADADTVSGTAPAFAYVEVHGGSDSGDAHRSVQADASGFWIADFSTPGDEDHEENVLDLGLGTGGAAQVFDDDGDSTHRGWWVVNPTFSVETPWNVRSGGEGWVEYDTITMTVSESTAGVLFTDTTTVERWGPEPWEVGFEFNTEGEFDIAAGHTVNITATDTVKVLDVVGLTVDVIDADADTVAGTAPPDAFVEVHGGDESTQAVRTVQADAAGSWLADFSVPGPEQEVLDIVPGIGGEALVYDDDEDATYRGWCFECGGGQKIDPIPMEPGEILISQTDGVLWVYDPETGSLDDHQLPFDGTWDIQWIETAEESDLIAIANSGDARIWVLDLETGYLEPIAEGEPFQFPIGLALYPPVDPDTLWVADHGAGILRLDDDGVEVVVEPFGSPDGIVVADDGSEDGTVYFTDQSGTLYRVDDEAPDNYAEVATAEGYGLNGLVMTPNGNVLATSTWPSALVTFDLSTNPVMVTIDDYSGQMRSSEDSAFGANGDVYVTDSGMVLEFGDDPGLYLRSGELVELVRGEPFGDIVDLLIKPGGHVNTPPAILSFEGPADPYPVGSTVLATAMFADSDDGDIHTATIEWGDGEVTQPEIIFADDIGTIVDSHAYEGPGVYTLTLTVDDGAGGSATAVYEYAVTYDPAGRQIIASVRVVDTGGEDHLGVNIKVDNQTGEPGGHVRYNFTGSGFAEGFVATSIESMLTFGSWGMTGGRGTVDGGADVFEFMVTAYDGDRNGAFDAFRFRMWPEGDPESVVYDTQPGDGLFAFPTREPTNGDIKVK